MPPRPKRIAFVNRTTCVACGTCANNCPKGAIDVWRGSFAVVESDLCIGCGKCAKACPIGAVQTRERNDAEGASA